jgi:transketolase
MLQRDIFIKEITKKLESDKSIYFLSADFGAAALDELREKFPKNFIHCGISEQAMIDIASGLALENNKVFVYAMAPFLSLRALEQVKCGPGLMELPICLISVGIGLGYADAGPTHYSNEDFACLNSLVGNSIFTPSDNLTTELIAKDFIKDPKFSYVRLDRDKQPDLNPKITKSDFEEGFKIFGEINDNKIGIISHGKIFHNCFSIFNDKKDQTICINLFKSKPFPNKLIEKIKKLKKILVVDEQTPGGNLGSCVFENFSNYNYHHKIKVKSLKDIYYFENGGRDYLLDKNGLSKEDIINEINNF